VNILIVDFDFFSTAGGGQTYYQTLVKRNPGAEFHFFTKANFSAMEEMRWKLPSNVHPIAYQEDRRSWFIVKELCKQFPCIAKELIYAYGTEAVNIAYSISGRSFDVADIPSFRPIHPILPALFEFNNVRCGKLALSIHGWMHKAMDLCWERPEELFQSLRLIDQACLETSDIRYEISKFNLLNTQQLTSMPLSYFDIHNVLEAGSSLPSTNFTDDQLPDIWFPARLDRQKGVDLFLEIIARVPRHLYGRIRLCGPDGNERGRTWLSRVHDLARSLGLEIVYHGTLLREQVFEQVFTKPNYCVFSSRYDSFGLAEIEALSAGCPSAISNQCGVAHFLAEAYPDIPFTIMDINKLDEASQKITDDLMRYKELRNNLLQSLLKNPFKPWVQDAVLSIYRLPEIRNSVQRTAFNKSVFLAIRKAKIYEILYTIRLISRRWISSVCPPRLKLIIRHLLNKCGFC
jgi:glycosyltransferase involved in cell wall biosynthesis